MVRGLILFLLCVQKGPKHLIQDFLLFCTTLYVYSLVTLVPFTTHYIPPTG